MNDLISRQAAIELWEEYHPYIAVKACEYGKRLRSLPSAERRGRWINDNHLIKCSICRCPIPINKVVIGGKVMWENNFSVNYCPNCGAKMDEVEE